MEGTFNYPSRVLTYRLNFQPRSFVVTIPKYASRTRTHTRMYVYYVISNEVYTRL